MKTKKILSGILAVALMLSLLVAGSVFASAAEAGNAAKIGDTEYATLAEAVKAVEKGTTATPTTITLLKNQSISSLMIGHQYPQNIIVDLNGYTLSSNAIVLTAYRSGTTLTVQNGTICGNSTSGTLRATYGGKLVLGDSLTVKGAGGSAALIYVDNGSVEIAAKDGVEFVGGKPELDFKQSANVNNKVNVAASIGRTYFGTLADAVAAAKADDTVTMMADASLSNILTIDKSITFDGNGKTLTSAAGRAINVATEGKVTIKNLTIDCSGERAINIIQKPATLTIDNVTATAGNYTVNVATSAGAAKVTITNSTLNGLCTVNVAGAGADVTITDSTINCNDKNTTVGESYAALCLNKDATGAKIAATGCTISVVEGSDSDVARNSATGGEITIEGSTDQVKTTVAIIDYPEYNVYHGFYTLQSAIEFAKDGDTITLIRDIVLENTVLTINKDITIDFNGHTVTGQFGEATTNSEVNGSLKTAVTQFVLIENATVTLKDSVGTGGLKAIAVEYGNLSNLIRVATTGKLIIKSGNYHQNLSVVGAGMIDSRGSDNITVEGGNFVLGNVGTKSNGSPWIFNTSGRNSGHINVVGGTFNADVFHQYYIFEVQVPDKLQGTLALSYDEETETYTVVDAVAYVVEKHGNYDMKIGYATLEEALAACDVKDGKVAYRAGTYYKSQKSEGETVVLLKDITLAENTAIVINDTITIDLNGKTISQTKVCTESYNMIANNGSLTINDSVGTGKIILTDNGSGDPNFGWGSYTIRNSGTLVVNNGTIEFVGTQTAGTHCSLALFQYSGSTTINGGNIVNNHYRSVRLWSGDIAINGGNFEGQVWVHCVNDTASLTINDGSFAPAKYGRDGSSVFVNNSGYTAKLSITGGYFATKVGANDVDALAGCITGGEFTESAKANTNSVLFA